MSALSSVFKPGLAKAQALVVEKDISGGVRIKLGKEGFVLPPSEAVRFADGILNAAGLSVSLTGAAATAIAASERKIIQ